MKPQFIKFIETAKEIECTEDAQSWEEALSKLTDKKKAEPKDPA